MENSIANRNFKKNTNQPGNTHHHPGGQRPKKLSLKVTTNLVLVPNINRTGNPVLRPVLKSF
jgi:hypothetical protein